MRFGGGEREAAVSTSATSNTSTANLNKTTRDKAMAKYSADAESSHESEQFRVSGKSFDYKKSVFCNPESMSEGKMIAYLSKIQRGGLVQPFGFMFAIEELTFRIIGYSENCFEFLGSEHSLESKQLRSLIGVDATTLFTPSSGALLAKAASSKEISFENPVLVYSRMNQKPFNAILHRMDMGFGIDFEPARSGDPLFSLAGAVSSQKLAVRAISKLQSLPGGDIGLLCDTVVEEVQKLTGYDRVMVYKFHEDDHGEVVSEIRRSNLEPYLGSHYPATDIPQAARFLFKQNRVRMICDCHANPISVIQSEELKQSLCLLNSTLRSPHSCHTQYMANMGSVASLVMAVVINRNDRSNLWGLVVCHHSSPRFVPFPLRYACEFLMQTFGLQLYMELQLASQLAEKKMLRTQTLLCDMLLRDGPFGIVTRSPSIMDLVKCDGAALYYSGNCWLLGVTPTESQVRDITEWLLKTHWDSTGLSTDSIADAGYPGAPLLGDEVCGMAAARISSKDFLFWFRSHHGKEIKWGGSKHHPQEKDDGGKMHPPGSSFYDFLVVVKSRSLPWEESEINAIHSLQLIVRDSIQEIENCGTTVLKGGQKMETEVEEVDDLSSVTCEMVRLIETATVPIFGVDLSGSINGWNEKIAELTGLQTSEAMGKSLVHEVVNEGARGTVESLLCRALQGEEDKNVALKLKSFGHDQQNSVVYIIANACISRDYTNNIVGVCFVGQDITKEKAVIDKFIKLQGDYKAIIQSLNPLIPPIFACDENAYCSEWNAAMERLTGWARHEVIGKMLPGEVFGNFCLLKGQDMLTKLMIFLYHGISGQDTDKISFEFFDKKGKLVEVIIMANKRTDANDNVIGCLCFLEVIACDEYCSTRKSFKRDGECFNKLKELAYMRQEMRSPLDGIRFSHRLLEKTAISESQKQFLEISNACERQIMTIIEDLDFRSIEDSSVELNLEEFCLENVLDAIVGQAMILLREKNLQLFQEIPEETKSLSLFGDQIRLQLALSDFLLNVVHNVPSSDGWVEIKVSPGVKLMQDGSEFTHFQFRITHPGEGLPSAVIKDMYEAENEWSTQEGLELYMSRKLLSKMNGQVRYIREHDKCYFLIDFELGNQKIEEQGSASRYNQQDPLDSFLTCTRY